MKKYTKLMLKWNSIIMLSVYLIKCFIEWNIYNPIEWIINIPTYSNNQRFGIILCTIFYILFLRVVVFIQTPHETKYP
jgi:hypothetical protein